VCVGDPGVIDAQVVELGDDLIASRSIDNRIGALVVLEALRILSKKKSKAMVAAVAAPPPTRASPKSPSKRRSRAH
jgi:endoglucanase